MSGADLDTWALAMAAVGRTPLETPQQRAARERHDRRLVRVAVAFSGTVVVLALLMALLDPGDDRSTWRFVTGATVAVLALVVLVGGPLARPGGATLQGVGLAMAFVGSWMMKPSGYRAVVALVFVAAVVGLALHQRREERLARRFLEEHPEPAP